MSDGKLHRVEVLESLDFAACLLTAQAQCLRASHYCKESSHWDEPEIEAECRAAIKHAFRLRVLAKQILDGKPRSDRVADAQSAN